MILINVASGEEVTWLAGDNCRGPCNARYRRAMADYGDTLAQWQERREDGEDEPRPEEPDIRPWLGAPIWCTRCQPLIRRQLAELDDLAAIITATADGHRGAADEDTRVRKSKNPPSPSPTSDDVDDLIDTLRNWESAHRGTDPLSRRGDLATEFHTIISSLLFRFDAMITNPDYAQDYGAEIRVWHNRLSARGKAGTGVTPRHLPCPRCNRRSLVQEQGADYIRCTNPDCQRLLNMDDYDAELDERRRRVAVTKEKAAA